MAYGLIQPKTIADLERAVELPGTSTTRRGMTAMAASNMICVFWHAIF